MQRNKLICALLLCSLLPQTALSESFFLSTAGRNSVVGKLGTVRAKAEDSLIDIARRYDLGHDEIISANRNINRWVPGAGTKILLPNQFVLPDAPRDGIIINLAEFRLYYFPHPPGAESQLVMTFPVSIGRMDWQTPLGKTVVASKERDPAWRPPASIRREHLAEGEELPDYIPGGDPTNPLGRFALRLGVPGYLIHGTDERKAFGIGMNVTHGCIRMYPEDVEQLYAYVTPGTAVYIVNQPVKVGWSGADLLLEVHQANDSGTDDRTQSVTTEDLPKAAERGVTADRASLEELTPVTMAMIEREVLNTSLSNTPSFERGITAAIKQAIQQADGVPLKIGTNYNSLPPADTPTRLK